MNMMVWVGVGEGEDGVVVMKDVGEGKGWIGKGEGVGGREGVECGVEDGRDVKLVKVMVVERDVVDVVMNVEW